MTEVEKQVEDNEIVELTPELLEHVGGGIATVCFV